MAAHRTRQQGLTLVELLVAVAAGALVLLAAMELLRAASPARDWAEERLALERDARFAMQRIDAAVRGSRRVLVPLPVTLTARNVLAVTLDPMLDRNGDGIADADNDGSGVVDEDPPADETYDGAPGVAGIDDDGDGTVDETASGGVADNDETGTLGVAPVPPRSGKDWVDVVAFRVSGGQLLERLPDIGASNGGKFTERPIAEGVTAFAVQRLPTGPNRRELLDVSLTLTGPRGQTVTATARLRVGP